MEDTHAKKAAAKKMRKLLSPRKPSRPLPESIRVYRPIHQVAQTLPTPLVVPGPEKRTLPPIADVEDGSLPLQPNPLNNGDSNSSIESSEDAIDAASIAQMNCELCRGCSKTIAYLVSEKGTLSNLLTLLAMVCGLYIRRHCAHREPTSWVDAIFGGMCTPLEVQFGNVLLWGGAFGLSGGLTNSIAIHMLFEPVCNLPGTGVIPRNFKEIRKSVKDTMMRTFFDGPHVQQFVESRIKAMASSLDLGAKLVDVLSTQEADELITKALTGLLEKPEGWPLLLFGAAPAELTTMVKPFLLAMAPEVAPLLEKMVDPSTILPVEKVREEIDGLMESRLQELSPERVKELIQEVIRKQLGWLVVWGNVAGALIGVATVLVSATSS